MRRRRTRLAGLLLGTALVAGVGACGSGGSVDLPTLPTTFPTLPTVTFPTLPTETVTTPATSRTEQQGTVTVTRSGSATTVTSTVTTAPQPTPTSTSLAAWVWVVLALLLLALLALLVWLVRRSRTRADWDDRMAVARRDAGWVEEALVPQVLGRGTTAEAAAAWRGAQPRLMQLDELLYGLATTAPDPERAGHAGALRSRVAALVDAMGADTATGEEASVDDLRTRRAAVGRARTELRTLLDAYAARR